MGGDRFKGTVTIQYAAMVKWYNESLPRISRGFDYPWPHHIKILGLHLGFLYGAWVIERAFVLDYEADAEIIYPKGVLRLCRVLVNEKPAILSGTDSLD